MPRTRHILSVYVYDTLKNRYGFSISVQPEIDCTTFHSFFSWIVWKKKIFKIFKIWQVCDWLAKWIIMLGFMDLRWPRVFWRSSVGLGPGPGRVIWGGDRYIEKIRIIFHFPKVCSANPRIFSQYLFPPPPPPPPPTHTHTHTHTHIFHETSKPCTWSVFTNCWVCRPFTSH